VLFAVALNSAHRYRKTMTYEHKIKRPLILKQAYGLAVLISNRQQYIKSYHVTLTQAYIADHFPLAGEMVFLFTLNPIQ
jgi:hypothetical protein